MDRWLWIWIAVVSLITFVTYGWDKFRAVRDKSRISEFQLCLFAALGGSLGAWIAMSLWRHKTRKRSFQFKLVVATLLQAAWMWLWWQQTRMGLAVLD